MNIANVIILIIVTLAFSSCSTYTSNFHNLTINKAEYSEISDNNLDGLIQSVSEQSGLRYYTISYLIKLSPIDIVAEEEPLYILKAKAYFAKYQNLESINDWYFYVKKITKLSNNQYRIYIEIKNRSR
jgi:hypothetical protein